MRRFSHFTVKRLGVATALGLLALLVLTTPAFAGVTWCRADPIVQLNGTDVQIWVAVPDEYAPLVNGPIDVRVRTPRAVNCVVVFTDAGFNGYGETVTFDDRPGRVVNGAFEARVEVRVPMNLAGLPLGTTIPMQVEVIPAAGKALYFDGTTNRTVFTVTVQGAK